ncbi:MAG: reverse transcriptase/maturase family protein [Deltaproteobacteria bacterium]|nr:reverse transcriptase/maturase family protein [Deltaproteobacteria bacterium]
MRRVGGLWPQVTAFDNLLSATRRAAQGKRHQRHVARFLIEREPMLLGLRRSLLDGSYTPGRLSTFVIHDPKLRTIGVAPFRDRVVHHAVIDVLEPVLDRRMIDATFACRRGKGTHAALDRAQTLVRRHAWFLKMDVAQYFASVPHAVVMEAVTRIIKDRRVLALFERIVIGGGRADTPGRGLPIGNLTSQWFANLVLGRLDHHVLQRMHLAGYLRYLDDFVMFAETRQQLQEAQAEVTEVLASLGLRPKTRATMLGRSGEGLPFLGFVLYPAVRRVRPDNRKRIVQRWKRRLWEYRQGVLEEEALADAVRSMMVHLEHGTTRGWRRRWCTVLEGRGPPG